MTLREQIARAMSGIDDDVLIPWESLTANDARAYLRYADLTVAILAPVSSALTKIADGPAWGPYAEPWSKAEALIALQRMREVVNDAS
jgi:hypothetical protein